jgi:hypothetical protein
VAGPVHTYQLARPGGQDFSSLLAIHPVVLKDSRLHGLGIPGGHDTTRPYALNFTPLAKEYPFLKLDDAGESPTAGWNGFFWNNEKYKAEPGKYLRPIRGFFTYYPVERLKPASQVVATFAGPRESRIGEKTDDFKDQQPFIVAMPYGPGRSLYLGSGEFWRLRSYKDGFHERFWRGMIRYVAAGKFAKVDPPKTPAEKDPKSVFKEKKFMKVLVIDGEGVRGRHEGGDSFSIERAIASIPGKPYEVVFGHDLPGAGGDAARALERDDLGKFGAVLLLNVPSLKPMQLANLEKYSKAGGGVAFFLGPNVSSVYYNKNLFKQGKGLFPVPLEGSYFPPPNEKALEFNDDSELQLRNDIFPDMNRYSIVGELADFPGLREVLKTLSIHRSFKVPRAAWRPEPGRSFELATLANAASSTIFEARVGEITRGELSNKVLERKEYKEYRPGLERHLRNLEDLVRPGAEKKSRHLVKAIDDMLLDRGLKELWKNPDPNIRSRLETVARLRQQARYGDPLMVGGHFGKGRVVAVLTTAGEQWNDLAGGSPASVVYAPFIWETLNYLTGQERREKRSNQPGSGKARPPQLLGIDLAFAGRKPQGKGLPQELLEAVLVTPDVLLPFRGRLTDDTGLSKAHWVVQVHQVEFVAGKFSKLLAPRPEQRFPLPSFQAKQEKSARDEFLRNILSGAKDLSYPSGFFRTHFLEEETGFDFQKHLAQLKAKKDEPQNHYLVKLWISATSSDPKAGTNRSVQPFLFLVVSENEWLSQFHREGPKILEGLENFQEKLRAAQNTLDDQIEKLGRPDADRSVIALRVAEIGAALQSTADDTREAAQFYGRVAHGSEINRFHPDRINVASKICLSLDGLVHRGDTDFGKAAASLHILSAMLDKGKNDTLLKQAREVRDKLKGLDKNLNQSVDLVSEWIVEGKLIEFLEKIEIERSRPMLREPRPTQIEMIERLLQKSPGKKK